MIDSKFLLCILLVSLTPDNLQASSQASSANSAEEHSVVFEPSGYYAFNTHYLHVRLPIPLQPIFNSMDYAKDRIKNHNSYYYKDAVDQIQVNNEAAIRSLEDKFFNLVNTLPHHRVSPNDRHARFLDIIAGISGIVWGAYNAYKLQGLDARLAKQEQELALMKDISQLHDNHLKNLDTHISLHEQMFRELVEHNPAVYQSYFNTITTQLRRNVGLVTSAVSHAQRHRLAPGVFSSESMQAVVDHVQLVAEDNDYISFVHHPSDLYQLETSYLYEPNNKTFITILHVPMVKKEHLLTMYKFLPLPLATHLGENSSLVPDVGHQDIIAVEADQKGYKVLSSSDLLHCLHLGNHHFCQGDNILSTNFKSTCLGAIYMGDYLSTRRHCNFKIQKKKETVYDLGNNQYKVYCSNCSYTTWEECPNTKSPLKIFNGVTLHVGDGCFIDLKENIILANSQEEIQLETENRVLTWAWNMSHMFPNVSSTYVEEALKSLNERGFHNVDASDLLHQLDLVAAKPLSEFYTNNFTAPMASVIGALLLLGAAFLLCCCRKCCCAQKCPPKIPLSANQAPTVVVIEPRIPAPTRVAPSNFGFRPPVLRTNGTQLHPQYQEEPELFK